MTATPLRVQVAELARRSILQTLSQPLLIVPPVLFPLVLVAVNSSGLQAATRIPGFPTDNYVDFAIAVAFIQGALFAMINAGSALARDVETGFLRRLAMTPMQRPALLIGQLSAREQIQGLADTDDLTGIANKRYFRRQLPQEMERARVYSLPLTLLMFDIDDFKAINDSFGHTVGDVVLSELCGAVRETLRPPDLFARFGGDEFAIILPHTDLGGACSVADRILQKVRALTIPADDEGTIRCSISLGIADYQRSDGTAADVIRRADERLYEAKRSGKNRYCLSS